MDSALMGLARRAIAAWDEKIEAERAYEEAVEAGYRPGSIAEEEADPRHRRRGDAQAAYSGLAEELADALWRASRAYLVIDGRLVVDASDGRVCGNHREHGERNLVITPWLGESA